MRLAYAALLVAACGSEEGSLLTIRAPAGPDNVARLEIVLANPSPDTITTLDDQRITPASATMVEPVRYYRQLATAGQVTGVGNADGFTIRIEPNVAASTDKTFIPFLVAFDAQDNVVGVGVMKDEGGEPGAITIESGMTRQYFIDMVALKPMDLAQGMAALESAHLQCGSDRVWTSGIAWRPGQTQLRLLLADKSEDAHASNATLREADLDCDGFEAKFDDCDDLRPMFHPGREDVCDGQDMNCDGARTVVQSCSTSACANGSGVQLCDDRTGRPIGACLQDAQCACESGACTQCTMQFKNTQDVSKKAPCAPSVGKMHFANCTSQLPCTLEVLGASSPFVGYISNQPTSGFTTKISVTLGEAYIELKLSGTSEVMASANQSMGTLNLMLTQGDQNRLVPVDIRLTENAVTACQPNAGTNLFLMTCTP